MALNRAVVKVEGADAALTFVDGLELGRLPVNSSTRNPFRPGMGLEPPYLADLPTDLDSNRHMCQPPAGGRARWDAGLTAAARGPDFHSTLSEEALRPCPETRRMSTMSAWKK